MMDSAQLLEYLRTQEPDYWAWLQTKSNALNKVVAIAEQLAGEATGAGHRVTQLFIDRVRDLTSYQTWKGLPPPEEEPPPEEDPPPEEEPPPEEGPSEDTWDATDAALLASLQKFLLDYGLPLSLLGFIQSSIANGWGFEQIVLELRNTPEYQAAFPENRMRQEHGLSWMPESEILAYRDEAKRLAQDYLGISVSNAEISDLIGRGTSLSAWEHRLQTWNKVQEWGPYVQQVFLQEIGMPLSDERLYAFFDPDMPTPELDKAYQHALYRGQPAMLGIGIRPEEEAELLGQFGITPEKAFAGYQGVVAEMPRYERLGFIEYYLNQHASEFPDVATSLSGASFGTLFRAIQLGDIDAIQKLAAMQSREIARFRAGGGPTGQGSGRPGLVSRT